MIFFLLVNSDLFIDLTLGIPSSQIDLQIARVKATPGVCAVHFSLFCSLPLRQEGEINQRQSISEIIIFSWECYMSDIIP